VSIKSISVPAVRKLLRSSSRGISRQPTPGIREDRPGSRRKKGKGERGTSLFSREEGEKKEFPGFSKEDEARMPEASTLSPEKRKRTRVRRQARKEEGGSEDPLLCPGRNRKKRTLTTLGKNRPVEITCQKDFLWS